VPFVQPHRRHLLPIRGGAFTTTAPAGEQVGGKAAPLFHVTGPHLRWDAEDGAGRWEAQLAGPRWDAEERAGRWKAQLTGTRWDVDE
jgi:hypothetical protein